MRSAPLWFWLVLGCLVFSLFQFDPAVTGMILAYVSLKVNKFVKSVRRRGDPSINTPRPLRDETKGPNVASFFSLHVAFISSVVLFGRSRKSQ